MEELKQVLENLNSALFGLLNLTKKVEEKAEEQRIQDLKFQEKEDIQKKKAEELNEREKNISHIESIAQAQKEAKELMVKARDLMTNANEKQIKLDEGLKQLASDKAKLEKEKEDFMIAQKKQIEAFKKDKDKFEEEIREFKIKKKVSKELDK